MGQKFLGFHNAKRTDLPLSSGPRGLKGCAAFLHGFLWHQKTGTRPGQGCTHGLGSCPSLHMSFLSFSVSCAAPITISLCHPCLSSATPPHTHKTNSTCCSAASSSRSSFAGLEFVLGTRWIFRMCFVKLHPSLPSAPTPHPESGLGAVLWAWGCAASRMAGAGVSTRFEEPPAQPPLVAPRGGGARTDAAVPGQLSGIRWAPRSSQTLGQELDVASPSPGVSGRSQIKRSPK